MKYPTLSSTLQAITLLLAVAFFGFCIWNSALLEADVLAQRYILTLTLCTFGLLAFASSRIAFPLMLSGGTFFLLKFIAVMKQRYLESPLMPADFIYYVRSSLIETLQQYPNISSIAIVVCVVFILLAWLVWRFDIRFLPELRKRWHQIPLQALGATAFALGFWWCMQPQGPFAPLYKVDIWSRLSGDPTSLANFFVNIRYMHPTLPQMSDAVTAERDWANTTTDANASNRTLYPDIVLVLEESTFDPSSLTACQVDLCKAKLFQSDQNTRASGRLRTHTFGGGTWVSEFTSLSGMPQDIFGPAGMYAPFVLAPRLNFSLATQLRKLGYRTIAVYPVGGNFLDARNAYKHYGFDEFYDVNDLGLEMWHTSDAQMFAAAKKVYDREKKPGQPVLLLITTLAQHGPHDSTPLAELPAPFNKGLQTGLSEQQNLNLSAYLSRLKDSDTGMTQLENDFLNRPQPTILMHYGDHQPSFNGLIRTMDLPVPPEQEAFKNNLTYYMLKSNFESSSLPEYPVLDIAYLPSRVLRTAGLPGGPYFSALSHLEERCHGLYTDCSNKALLESYHAWVFNHLHAFE